MLKRIFVTIYFILVILFTLVHTIIFGIMTLVAALFALGENRVSQWVMVTWSKWIIYAFGTRIKIDGIDNIDKKKVQIFASNHSSYTDIWVLNAVLPVSFAWISKKEIFYYPIIGWHMKACGFISIDRSNREKAIASMNKAAEEIKSGRRIIIFPEGTRTKTKGQLGDYKKGPFHLCLQTGVPIIPVYIDGTYDILKSGTYVMQPFKKVFVKIGKEMPTDNYKPGDLKSIMGDLRKRHLQLQEDMEQFKQHQI